MNYVYAFANACVLCFVAILITQVLLVNIESAYSTVFVCAAESPYALQVS